MKKVIMCIFAIFLIIATVGVVALVLVSTGVLNKEDIDLIKVYEYTTDDGLIYTEAEWDWHAYENKHIIKYKEDVSEPVKNVTLNINDTTFYDVTIPDKSYIYDFGKTIWAEDGTFVIRVIGEGSLDNLSGLAGIDDGVNINRLTLVSPEKTKGRRTIATLIDDTAIVADVYGSDEDYSIIRDSLASNHNTYQLDDIPISNDCTVLSNIVYEGKYAPQVILSDVSLKQDRYLFKDGLLWVASMTEPYYITKDIYKAKLITSSGGVIEEMYDDNSVFFARSGDYYIGVVSRNVNTCIVMIGKGEEAFCNIVSIISMER